MRIHLMEHEPVSLSLNIMRWAEKNQHQIIPVNAAGSDPMPALRDLDRLIIAGGPQHIWEEGRHPWLGAEKEFISRAVQAGKTILGICLGAQLIAEAMGGKVFSNRFKALGWYDVSLTADGISSSIFEDVPERFTIFQWHSDRYTLPPECIRLAASPAAENQAFLSTDNRILGIQFHPDFDCGTIAHMIKTLGKEYPRGPYVTERDELLQQTASMREPSWLMDKILDNFLIPI